MKSILDRYLDRVLVFANKPPAEAEPLRQELKDHLLQKVEDLVEGGMAKEEAIIEALRAHGSPKAIGYGLRGPFPWIDVRSYGTARGVVAIGPKAVGIFAFGGIAMGVFACGGLSLGLFSVGGTALGLLFAWGGIGMGALVYGGIALGLVAAGGMALGVIAEGGLAVGTWVPKRFPGTVAFSHYRVDNVPRILKHAASLLRVPAFFERYMAFILPAYIVTLSVFFYVQYRETKRVRLQEDWLLDG